MKRTDWINSPGCGRVSFNFKRLSHTRLIVSFVHTRFITRDARFKFSIRRIYALARFEFDLKLNSLTGAWPMFAPVVDPVSCSPDVKVASFSRCSR